MNENKKELMLLLKENLRLNIEGSYLEIYFDQEQIDSIYIGYLENDE